MSGTKKIQRDWDAEENLILFHYTSLAAKSMSISVSLPAKIFLIYILSGVQISTCTLCPLF